MEEFCTPFPPLQRAPLRFQGIFGVANTLYKRSFKSLLLLTLLFIVLPMLVMCIGPVWGLSSFIETIENHGLESSYESFFGMFGFMGITSLLSTAYSFLLAPAYNGALYLELDQCVEGRRGTIGQVLKYAVPLGFKQYYTTFLCYMLVQVGASLVIMLVLPIFSVATIIPMIVSTIDSTTFPVFPMMLSFTFLYVILMFLANIILVFTGSIYPAAVHERIRAFKAIGRSFQLGASRFGRMLGVWSLFMFVVIILVFGLILVPLLFLNMDSTGTIITYMAVIFLITSIFTLFITPYSGCVSVALYIDAAARKPLDEPRNPYAPPMRGSGATYGYPLGDDIDHGDTPKQDSLYGRPLPGDDLYEKPQESSDPDEGNDINP